MYLNLYVSQDCQERDEPSCGIYPDLCVCKDLPWARCAAVLMHIVWCLELNLLSQCVLKLKCEAHLRIRDSKKFIASIRTLPPMIGGGAVNRSPCTLQSANNEGSGGKVNSGI